MPAKTQTTESKQEPESHNIQQVQATIQIGKVPWKFQLPDEKQSTDTTAEMIPKLELLDKDFKATITKMLEQAITYLATKVKTVNWRYKNNQMENLKQDPKLKSSQQQNGEDREVSELENISIKMIHTK